MDAKIKAEWVSLLRYGGLKQHKRSLHNPEKDSFCCLGVLCELARVYDVVELDYKTYYSDKGSSSGHLPEGVVRWAGLNCISPLPEGSITTLAGLNDEGITFPEIADIIEKGL